MGIEAGSRAADTLQIDTTKFNSLLSAVVTHCRAAREEPAGVRL
jgi:hypothetical protein